MTLGPKCESPCFIPTTWSICYSHPINVEKDTYTPILPPNSPPHIHLHRNVDDSHVHIPSWTNILMSAVFCWSKPMRAFRWLWLCSCCYRQSRAEYLVPFPSLCASGLALECWKGLYLLPCQLVSLLHQYVRVSTHLCWFSVCIFSPTICLWFSFGEMLIFFLIISRCSLDILIMMGLWYLYLYTNFSFEGIRFLNLFF